MIKLKISSKISSKVEEGSNDSITVYSKDLEGNNLCDFKIEETLERSVSSVSFSILEEFDAEGAELELYLNDEMITKTDFVALTPNCRHGQWGNVFLNLPQTKEGDTISIRLAMFSEEPFKVVIQKLTFS